MRPVWLLLAAACDHAPPVAPAETPRPRPVVAAPADAAPPVDAAPADRWVVLAKDQKGPTRIALTATDVVWLDETGGQVMKVPKAGGTVVELARHQETPLDLAVDDDHAYWTTRTGNGDSDSITAPHPTGGVWSVPLAGGKVTALAKGRAFPDAIAVGATAVYFGEQGLTAHKGAQLAKVGKTGGSVTKIHDGAPGGIAVDGADVYWSIGGGCESVNGAKMPDDGSMWTSPVAKGSAKELAPKLRCPERIATDADAVYVADNDDGTILAIPKTGGAPVVVATDDPGTRWLAVDATTVYWINQRTRKVKRHPKSGGSTELLAEGKDPSGIAVDDRYVFVTDGDVVERMDK